MLWFWLRADKRPRPPLPGHLSEKGFYISTGSACSAKKAGNRTLEAMGKTLDDVVGSVRLSFSAYEMIDEMYVANVIIKNVLRFLKNLKK